MGRAIVREPSVFLFDEPLSNLDAKLRVQMRAEIKGLHARLGTTILYVTHGPLEAMTMADRIVVMNAGRIEQVGTPIELYDKPANTFVAGFLGSPAMSFIPAQVDAQDPCMARTAAGSRLQLPLEAPCGRDVLLGSGRKASLSRPAGPTCFLRSISSSRPARKPIFTERWRVSDPWPSSPAVRARGGVIGSASR